MKSPKPIKQTPASLPDFYMPAMWPVDLQHAIADWLGAWWWRRRLRRLLARDADGQIRLGSARAVVAQGAAEPLRLIARRRACWLRGR